MRKYPSRICQPINDPSSLSNTFYNDCGCNSTPLSDVNCSSASLKLPCLIKIPSECIIYNGIAYPDYNIAPNQTLNQVLTQIITNLGTGGGGGLSQVYTTNSSTVNFSGDGTQFNPLTANVVSSISNLQQVTTNGNTTSTGIQITGSTVLPSGNGTYLGNGVIYSGDLSNNTFQPFSIQASNLTLASQGSTFDITANVGNITLSSLITDIRGNSLILRSNSASPARFLDQSNNLARVKGANAIDNDDFITLSQLNSAIPTPVNAINNLYSLTTPQTASSTINGSHFIIDGTVDLTTINNVSSATVSTKPKILIARTTDQASNIIDHGFADNSIFLKTVNNVSYNSFEAWPRVNGTANYDNYTGYQNKPILNTTGTTNNTFGFHDTLTINAGTLTKRQGIYIANPTGAGTISTNYGIYVENQTKGVVNYPIYIAGGTSYLGNRIQAQGITEQMRLGYDASNYLTTTVNSVGTTRFTLTGTNPLFIFDQAANLNGGFSTSSSTLFTISNLGVSAGGSAGVGQSITPGVIFGNPAPAAITGRVYMNGTTTTVIGANQNAANVIIGDNALTENSTGTHNIIANLVVKAPVITDGTATTTNAVSLYIDKAPIIGVNNYSLMVADGLSYFGGQVRILGGSPGTGKVLTSDANGLATWQTPSGGGSSLTTGSSTQSANGATVYTIPHGLGAIPSFRMVQAGSIDAANISYVEANNLNIIVYYDVAPPTGTNNLNFQWSAKI